MVEAFIEAIAISKPSKSNKANFMKSTLPNFFEFQPSKDLIRIGRDNDGGYLVVEEDVIHSEVLIGLGINDDWSFEEDFTKWKDVPVLAFDASVNKKVFFRKILKNLVRVDSPGNVLHWLKVYSSYNHFFSGSHRHIEKFVGLRYGDRHITMEEVFEETPSGSIFLKIDIEGSEYRILDCLLSNQNRISGMVIEFHDCDLHLERIEGFLEKFALRLVHIHANNYAPLEKGNGLPLVLELTFSRYASVQKNIILPHPLDMPNDSLNEEIHLRFE
mgnify:CR=1 FL=1